MKRYLLTLTTVLILFAGCGTLGMGAGDVREGMTYEEVQRRMGRPLTRSFEREIEEWHYYTEYINPTVNVTRIVTFKKGRVISMQSFTEQRVIHRHP